MIIKVTEYKSSLYRRIALVLLFVVLVFNPEFSQGQASAPLVVGVVNEMVSSHPLEAKSNEEKWVAGLLFYPLFVRNSEWEFECRSCQKIPTTDNELATLKSEGRRKILGVSWEIQKDLTWGDGTPVTAKDFRLAWEMSMSQSVTSINTIGYKAIAAFDLDPKNPRKFILTYNESKHDFMNNGVLYPVPNHLEESIWRDSAVDWSNYRVKTKYTTNPESPGLYNGDFIRKEAGKDKSQLFVRNKPLKNPQGNITSVKIRFMGTADALINELVAGNIDLLPENILDQTSLAKFQSVQRGESQTSSKYRIINKPGTSLEAVFFNLRNPTLIDRNIRWALAETLDRAAIAKNIVGSDCCLATQLANPNDVKMLDGAFTNSINVPDLKSAKTRLKSSGWSRGADGIWVKDDKKLQIKIEYAKGDNVREKLAVLLASEWNKNGFLVTSESIPNETFTTETVRKARFISIALYGVKLRPGEIPQALMHSREIPTLQNGYSGQNSMGWSSQTIDAALTAIPWEYNEDSRKEYRESIFKTFTNELPLLPLFFHPVSAVASSSLPGFKVNGHDYPSSCFVSKWSEAPIAAKKASR